MAIRINVHGPHTARVGEILTGARELGVSEIQDCAIARVFFLSDDLSADDVELLCSSLLVDPVTESYNWTRLSGTTGDEADVRPDSPSIEKPAVEVAYRAGVTDITARELLRGMQEIGLPKCEVVTASRYEFTGDLADADLHLLSHMLLCNQTVEHYALGCITPQFGVTATASDRVEIVPLRELNEERLAVLSRERLLFLDVQEMLAIQDFYAQAGRDPTDVELETLAQTWSEHCIHKTFRAQISFTWLDEGGQVKEQRTIDGLLRQYIRAATEQISPPWLRSAFVDDAGIVAFDDKHDLAFKVETHNHPSALEPFGGANTGIGGVVRDILGVSARPIATTDVLCFGPQDYPTESLPDGLLHPRRIASGVVAGVGDYGNKLGLPTVNGAVLYDDGYLGNPLVFCGCAGILPAGSHPSDPQVGNLVVVIGGRTGRDGLHGATFSSAELTHETAEESGSAVQIGDPITEKGLIELVEAARDRLLYTAITDCGAGGLSSSVGEMGRDLGVDVELQDVLLKYPGLVPWEIWLSEAQERMVLAVPPDRLDALKDLAELWDVELSVLGRFTGSGDLVVRYGGRIVAELSMEFLHDGIPQRHLTAEYQDPAPNVPYPALPDIEPTQILLRLLAHPNVSSKEDIVRRYDHEVRGGTIVRPFTGPHHDGPSDAAVLKPLGTWQHNRAVTLSAGINPLIGQRDPYSMAVSAIDEAVRNAVAVGADPDRIAILDNFCWGNPTLPDRLGALVRTCQGCYDAAVAYGTPFISGKDSLNNEYNGAPIPGTLLISAIGIVPDLNACVTADLKNAGNRLYLLGETKPELGGSLLYHTLDITGGQPPSMPDEPLRRYRLLHQAIRQGLVEACHDVSEGGIAVALAEMSIGGRLGARVDLPYPDMPAYVALFSESNGRLLLEVKSDQEQNLLELLGDRYVAPLGEVADDDRFEIQVNGSRAVSTTVSDLVDTWKRSAAS